MGHRSAVCGLHFFAAQVVIDYVRYRRAIEPRLDRADEAKRDLRERITAAEAELQTTRIGSGAG